MIWLFLITTSHKTCIKKEINMHQKYSSAISIDPWHSLQYEVCIAVIWPLVDCGCGGMEMRPPGDANIQYKLIKKAHKAGGCPEWTADKNVNSKWVVAASHFPIWKALHSTVSSYKLYSGTNKHLVVFMDNAQQYLKKRSDVWFWWRNTLMCNIDTQFEKEFLY